MLGPIVTLILLGCCAISPISAGGGNEWTYGGPLGPSHWHVDYPNCGESRQSPINVDTSRVKLDKHLPPFDLSQLAQTSNVDMRLENVQGHTVEVHVSGDPILVTGGGLDGPYQVQQYHFHWGAKDERGSEHTFNDKHFPMEMHIVMFSTKYPNISMAMTRQDGLAVLAFLFEVGKKNENFDQLLQYFPNIQYNGDEYEIPRAFPIKSLLPSYPTSYYRYDGSLTTPPCFQTVVWTLFSRTIVVSEEQLNKFRNVKSSMRGEPAQYLTDDFRPTQPLNHRIVTTNDRSLIYNASGRMPCSDTISLLWLLGLKYYF